MRRAPRVSPAQLRLFDVAPALAASPRLSPCSSAKARVRDALAALQGAERHDADQDELRACYRDLEDALATLDGTDVRQLAFTFPTPSVRRDERERLRMLGRDPDMDAPMDEWPESCRRHAELFPEGMSFAAIGWVLRTRKQQAFKVYVKAVAKVRAALGGFEEALRAELEGRSETVSGWDVTMEYA